MSAVSYMEYLAFLMDRGYSPEWIENFMNNLKIKVEYFDKKDAINAATIISELNLIDRRCPECHQINWNDTMVAAQGLNYSCIVVTENIVDFPYGDSIEVMTPQDVIARVS